MLKVTSSVTYFGRNVHVSGPAAYLETWCEGAVAQCLPEVETELERWIEQVLPDGSARVPIAQAAEPDRATDTASALAARITATIRRLCDAVGERHPCTRRLPSTDDHDLALIISGDDPETLRRIGVLAVKLLELALDQTAPLEVGSEHLQRLRQEFQVLRQFAESRRLTASERAVLAAARERGIPAFLLDRWPFNEDSAPRQADNKRVVQLGWGIHSRRLIGTASDAVARDVYAVLEDRQALQARLKGHGIPVPVQDPELPTANSARRAIMRARRIGFPVVLKARYRSGGHTVLTRLSNEDAVAQAYARLTDQHRRDVVVERQVEGDSYRVLIAGSTVIALLRVAHAGTEGTIAPGVHSAVPVPVERLSGRWRATAMEAVGLFDLPIAAVDLVTPDLSGSGEAGSGAVVGLDPAPDLGSYAVAGETLPRLAARQLLDHLFPAGINGRIPICAVTGTNGKTTTSRMVAKILSFAGRRVGLGCTDGVYVDGKRIVEGTSSGIAGALTVLCDRAVDFAVLETSRGTLVQKGLAFEDCEVAACTNIASDHLGEDRIETLEEMARLKRVVVEAATECAVLNADDPLCLAMMPVTNSARICLVSSNENSAEVEAHLRRGGSAVVLLTAADGAWIALRDQNALTPVVRANDIPATWNGAAHHNIQNAMFAAALAWGHGVDIPTIRSALSAFTSSIEETPGRLNVYDKLPFRVVLDFAHNAHGLQTLCDFVSQLGRRGRRHLVAYWTRSTPREPDLLEAMKTVAPYFDRFVCRDAAGTAPDELGKVAAQVEAALLRAGVPREAVRLIPDFQEAIDITLSEAQPGDLVVIITGSKAQQVWQRVEAFRAQLRAAAQTA